MRVRRLAHGMGYRYRLHAKELPGRPDLVFRPRRKAIFVQRLLLAPAFGLLGQPDTQDAHRVLAGQAGTQRGARSSQRGRVAGERLGRTRDLGVRNQQRPRRIGATDQGDPWVIRLEPSMRPTGTSRAIACSRGDRRSDDEPNPHHSAMPSSKICRQCYGSTARAAQRRATSASAARSGPLQTGNALGRVNWCRRLTSTDDSRRVRVLLRFDLHRRFLRRAVEFRGLSRRVGRVRHAGKPPGLIVRGWPKRI